MSRQISIRLDTFLARAGVSSRRGAHTLINEGKIYVNGKKIHRMVILKETDEVEMFHNQSLRQVKAKEMKISLYALNKPVGFVTSTKRLGKEKIVVDLLPVNLRKILRPVGRLDKDTSGLLLFTNHGPILQQLINPASKLEKEYSVTVRIPKDLPKEVIENKLRRLSKGFVLDGIKTRQAVFELSGFGSSEKIFIRVILKEGKNRQIRRMLGGVDLPVESIHRVRIGRLQLSDLHLKHGKYKEISLSNLGIGVASDQEGTA